eukprot:Pgem_evm1s19327
MKISTTLICITSTVLASPIYAVSVRTENSAAVADDTLHTTFDVAYDSGDFEGDDEKDSLASHKFNFQKLKKLKKKGKPKKNNNDLLGGWYEDDNNNIYSKYWENTIDSEIDEQDRNAKSPTSTTTSKSVNLQTASKTLLALYI